MAEVIAVVGAKGGVGCSTVAAAMAIERGGCLLVDAATGDLDALLGAFEPTEPFRLHDVIGALAGSDADWRVLGRAAGKIGGGVELITADRLHRWWTPGDAGHLVVACRRYPQPVIIDCGVSRFGDDVASVSDRQVLVCRNDFVSLRRAIAREHGTDHTVVIMEDHRPNSRQDVSTVLHGRGPVTLVDFDPVIARANDAGLLTSRLPRRLRDMAAAVRSHKVGVVQ